MCVRETHGVSQVCGGDDGAALLLHLQTQSGVGVSPRPAPPSPLHQHLHHARHHGHTIAYRDGDGVVVVGAAGMAILQDSPGHVTEGEGVTWRHTHC